MYNSIIAPNMLTLRGSHEFEWMDDTQLADLGIERAGNAILVDSRVIYKLPKFGARAFLSRIVKILAAIGLLVWTTASGSAAANDRVFWEGLPQWAYFEVYAYHCAPVELELADRVKSVPQGVAAVISEELFLAGYNGSCRDFYFQEVASRHDAPFEQIQGLVVLNR